VEPWYQTFFQDFYYDVWFQRRAVDAEGRSTAEADFVVQALALRPGASILDLCCGQGRIAVELARRGFRLTGLDLSANLLALGRQAASRAGVEVEWVQADMRQVPPGPFDAIINIFSAFGYLESDDEDQKVLDGVARALAPGGRFFLDVHSREHFIRMGPRSEWERLPDGALLLTETEINLVTSRWHASNTLLQVDGRSETQDFVVRQYSLTELVGMLKRAGLVVENTWGGYDGSPYTLESVRLIIMAARPS